MRAVRVVCRGFVYGTEDETRVVRALLTVLGRADEPEGGSRLTRSRIKAHYGGEIVVYEAVLKQSKDLRRFFDVLRAQPHLASTLRDEFETRLDDQRVLHFRMDKQAAVQGRVEIGSGGDAFDVQVKFETHPGAPRQGFPFE